MLFVRINTIIFSIEKYFRILIIFLNNTMATRKRIHYYRSCLPILISVLIFAIIGAIGCPISAQTVTSTFEVTNKPTEIAVNHETNLIYLVNMDADNVSVVDGAANQLVANVKVGSKPNGIGVNPITNLIYVGDSNGDISVIDGQTNKVITTIESVLSGLTDPSIPTPRPLPRKLESTPKHPDFIAVNPETNLIYVGSPGTFFMGVIDGVTHTVIDSIALIFEFGPGSGVSAIPTGIVVNPVINFIYVSSGFDVTFFFAIDGSSNRIADTDSFEGMSGDIALNVETNRIYVAQTTVNLAGVVDGSTNNIIATIGKTDPFTKRTPKIGINTSTNHVYVSDPESSKLYVINGFTNEIVNVLMEDAVPSCIAVNSKSNLVYVLDKTSSIVTVIEDNKKASTTPLKNLRADFITGNTNDRAPLTTQFKDLSTGDITDWLWEFGDGKTSSEQNPIHVYEREGGFSVKLTVSNSSETDTKEKTGLISVLPPHFPPGEFPEETPEPTTTASESPKPTPVATPTPEVTPPLTPVNTPNPTGFVIDINPKELSPSLRAQDIIVSIFTPNIGSVSNMHVKLKGTGFGAVVKTSSSVTNAEGIATVSGRFRFVSSEDATFTLTVTFPDGRNITTATIPKKTN